MALRRGVLWELARLGAGRSRAAFGCRVIGPQFRFGLEHVWIVAAEPAWRLLLLPVSARLRFQAGKLELLGAGECFAADLSALA